MIYVRKADKRRHIKGDVQDTYLTFDPENQDDPFRGGFRSLKGLNEEIPSPAMKLNPHSEVSIQSLTYVRKGAILDWGSTGRQTHIQMDEFHLASSGAKLRHEFAMNDSQVFQCWFESDGRASGPGVDRNRFTTADRKGVLRLIASSDGRNGSLRIPQDLQMYSSILLAGHHLVHEIGNGRAAWLHVVEGRVALQEHNLVTGDAAGFEDELSVSLTAQAPSEILLFNLA